MIIIMIVLYKGYESGGIAQFHILLQRAGFEEKTILPPHPNPKPIQATDLFAQHAATVATAHRLVAAQKASNWPYSYACTPDHDATRSCAADPSYSLVPVAIGQGRAVVLSSPHCDHSPTCTGPDSDLNCDNHDRLIALACLADTVLYSTTLSLPCSFASITTLFHASCPNQYGAICMYLAVLSNQAYPEASPARITLIIPYPCSPTPNQTGLTI